MFGAHIGGPDVGSRKEPKKAFWRQRIPQRIVSWRKWEGYSIQRGLVGAEAWHFRVSL